ncbi:DEAD/DEAH box helicase [Erwinia mallotivora]|uniref:DEAD/DEAH box helicase n=1 Tax=Erwinia mallotivora TaxID=69222 RepID=UPI0035E88436
MATVPLPQEILKAWQRIEFFHPYNLERKGKSLLISIDKLIRDGDSTLPWHSAELRQELEIPQKVSYTLHIGLFAKSLASELSMEVLGADESGNPEDYEQRFEEGTTCFAKVQLNSLGTPQTDKLSVSSLPWALGHLEKRRFSQLESTIFSSDCKQLADTLALFHATLKPVPHFDACSLRATDILTLLNTHLVAWADYAPQWQYAVQIDWFASHKESQDAVEEENEPEEEEELGEDEKARALPILNSFFFEDIEDAINSLKHHPCPTLTSWLSPSTRRNPDLYTQKGLASIIDKLHPMKMPQGRWPSAPEHPMSLMQQFAINTAVEELAEGGVLSVNGPPGTGKTTLLRDLIAHNIVERAEILATFSHVEETLDSSGFIVPQLTGFEMIIASSNNAAVENISHELPQKHSLAKEFCSVDYLSPVANQMAAELLPEKQNKKDKDGNGKERNYHFFRPLKEKQQCWGLISAALGKKANRSKFSQRLFIYEHFLRLTDAEKSRPYAENFLSLWRWKNTYCGLSFSDAKKNFLQCLHDVRIQQKQLAELADLCGQKSDDLLEKCTSALAENKSTFVKQINVLQQEKMERDIIVQEINEIRKQQDVIEENAPGLLTQLFNRGKVRAYRQELRSAQQSLVNLTTSHEKKAQRVAGLQKQLDETRTENHVIRQKITLIESEKNIQVKRLAELKNQFSGVSFPDVRKSVNDADLQRIALWQNEQINRRRSLLFIAAMDLHQAWLSEAMKLEHFRKKLRELKTFLESPHHSSEPLRYWQTLSLFVPVLSTTFASVGRMLRGVKSGELGWLMIDEAGQAAPPQAVGAIWRTKRVLVVGDPLQVEPVFTTSPVLVKHLCRDVLKEHAEEWNPATFSVQQISDRINRWGCELDFMGCNIWIGIPLWVHRRCIEPMFSIANKLAYNNRMIHGLTPDKIVSQPLNDKLDNHWLISRGGEGEKQYRDSHGQSLLILLDRILSDKTDLNSIYVITPFKAVKHALTELIEKRDIQCWKKHSPALTSKDILQWKKSRIGTVHTFQGKENDIVIFVHGCDEKSNGGAVWASSKPNLLNVAVTRAKKNIFVIGDPLVWQNLKGFDDLSRSLSSEQERNLIKETSNAIITR